MDEYVRSTLFPQLEQRLGQWVPQVAANVKSLLVAEAKAAEAERLERQRAELEAAQAAPDQPSAGGVLKQAIMADPLGTLSLLVDKLFDKYLAFQSLKVQQTNPFAFVRQLQQADPMLASYIGHMLSPDPLEQHLPGMLAHAGIKGFDAGMRVKQAAGGYNPFGPASKATGAESVSSGESSPGSGRARPDGSRPDAPMSGATGGARLTFTSLR